MKREKQQTKKLLESLLGRLMRGADLNNQVWDEVNVPSFFYRNMSLVLCLSVFFVLSLPLLSCSLLSGFSVLEAQDLDEAYYSDPDKTDTSTAQVPVTSVPGPAAPSREGLPPANQGVYNQNGAPLSLEAQGIERIQNPNSNKPFTGLTGSAANLPANPGTAPTNLYGPNQYGQPSGLIRGELAPAATPPPAQAVRPINPNGWSDISGATNKDQQRANYERKVREELSKPLPERQPFGDRFDSLQNRINGLKSNPSGVARGDGTNF